MCRCVKACKVSICGNVAFVSVDSRVDLTLERASADALLNLEAFLLLRGLDVALVEATNAIADGGEGKAFETIAFLGRQAQESMRQLVVVELLGFGVVESVTILQILSPMLY